MGERQEPVEPLFTIADLMADLGLDSEALDADTATETTRIFCDRVAAAMAHNDRAITTGEGAQMIQTLVLDPRLDEAAFRKELEGLSRVELQLGSAPGKQPEGSIVPQKMRPQVKVLWVGSDDRRTEVTMREGEPPEVMSYMAGADGGHEKETQGGITSNQAWKLTDIAQAAEGTREEAWRPFAPENDR